MTGKIYKASWIKIGNSSGYQLPNDFFREHPEFVETDGLVQVIAPDTVILSRKSLEAVSQDEDALMLSLFLEFLTQKALSDPSELEEYTQAMADEDDDLMAGVVLDDC